MISRLMIRQLIVLLMLCLAELNTYAKSDFTGPWHGDITLGQQRLPLVINISCEGNNYSATLDSPMQGAKDISADITISGDTIDIAIVSIGAKYKGILSDGIINGKFSQMGMTFNLALEPGEYIPPRPQSPHPPYAYETQQVSIVNTVDSTILAGTLTFPIEYGMPMFRKKHFPLVVMVSGSGLQNRDEEILGHRPFAVIAHHLAQNGIMTLRYDDRGYGESSGDATNATTETFASDANAIVDWARKNVSRTSQIGVLGHSEGGEIAFILASNKVPDFIITLAAPALRGDKLLLLQNKALSNGDASSSQYLIALERVFQFMADNPDAKEWPEIDDELADLNLLSVKMKDNLRAIISSRSPWLDYFLAFDPGEAIRNTNIPVFAVNGSLDHQVDATSSLDAIRKLLPFNQYNTVKEYRGLNHMFQHAKTGLPDEYGTIEETIAPELLEDLVEWIQRLSK